VHTKKNFFLKSFNDFLALLLLSSKAKSPSDYSKFGGKRKRTELSKECILWSVGMYLVD
jgi:hypothetical protein